VHDCIHAEKTKHPALICLGVKEQGTRPIASAKSEFEAELRNVEVYCAIQVSDGKVHFVEPMMELLCWRDVAGSVQGLTRIRPNFGPFKTNTRILGLIQLEFRDRRSKIAVAMAKRVAKAAAANKPKLLHQMRDVIRRKHYSICTEQAYINWINRFVLFKRIRSPRWRGC
jgi:hypothetical protein